MKPSTHNGYKRRVSIRMSTKLHHNDESILTVTMHIEAPAEAVWWYLATPTGMNTYLTDDVQASSDFIDVGDDIRIVIGDMVNDAVCLDNETYRLFRQKDRFRSLLADDSFIEYETVTAFRLEEKEGITTVTTEIQGAWQQNELMRWIRDCSVFGWRQSLFNLKLMLELGLDLRYSIFGYPRLGICNYTAEPEQLEAQSLPVGMGGNYIMEVFPGSPAEQAGLQTGDIIVAIDGQAVPTYGELVRALGKYGAAQEVSTESPVQIDYYRHGKRGFTKATLSLDKLLTGLVEPTEETVQQVTEGKRISNRPVAP